MTTAAAFAAMAAVTPARIAVPAGVAQPAGRRGMPPC